jgi:pimeloyl-ACP methyl ester carboxylesterase
VTTLLLIHGGLWEDGMDAESFWHKPGIVAGLQRHGFEVLTPNRRYRAPDWTAEVNHLAPVLPDRPVTILAGSNGCSVAVRLALAFPDRIERLLLAWPATANDPTVDAQSRAGLTELDASPEVVDALLTGQTLRGVTDGELATLRIPVGMLPSVPENPFHQRHTVDALRRLLPRADELPGCPEPPHPGFPPHTESFVSTVTGFAPR